MSKTKGRKTQYRGVKALGDGRYWLRVYVSDPLTGREREAVKTVEAPSAKDANRLRELEELRLREAVTSKAERPESRACMRFGELADRWLAEICGRSHDEDPTQPYLTPATQARYRETVERFLKPFFEDFIASRVTEDLVKKWRNGFLEVGYARSTINSHHRVLKTVLGTIGNDAAARVKALNERRDARITRAEPNLLTPEEMRRFLEVAKVRWPQHYALILLLFTTAMRIGTALALRWEDLDLDTMEIIVTRRLSGYGPRAEVVPGVKRDRFGEDAPPLLAEVLEELRTLRSGFNDAQLASGLLFPTRDGKHHYRTLLQKPFKDICEHAGITKRFTPHGCRRTGAKLYGRAAGTRMAMSIAGHMTEAMHEHYTPVDAQEKLAAASQVFGYLRAVEGAAAEDRTALEVETGTSTGTPGGEGAKTA